MALKKKTTDNYVLEQGFLAFKLSNIFYMRHRDRSNPFPFDDELLQECITIIKYYRIENRAYEEPASILLTSDTRNDGIPPPPSRAVLGLPSPSPRVCMDGRTDGR